MNIMQMTRKHARRSSLIALLVAAHGLVLIAGTLLGQFDIRRIYHHEFALHLAVDIPLLLGLALLYVSITLLRRKRTAWLLAVSLYLFLTGLSVGNILSEIQNETLQLHFVGPLLAPVFLVLLLASRRDFIVRSDIQTFATSVRVAVVVLIAAFLYGMGGYLLMDNHDFHQEITPLSAMHYTLDQFDLTTNQLHAYTKRAMLFQDSLTFISVSAVGFALVSLFQPLRARYAHAHERFEQMRALVYREQADSEDFFKLWPHDKHYFMSPDGQAGLAYKVQRGVALVAGNPLGAPPATARLVRKFEELCFVNDWRPAFVHVTPKWRKRLDARGYQTQFIGKEAIVDVRHFVEHVERGKYFRQIQNRFMKASFTTELLQPPHHGAVVDRLQAISQEWLQRPGREERQFMMGYFTEEYIQQCQILVARDAAGTVQAFINVLPSPVQDEANYDMMRSSERALGNINDFLLMQLLRSLHESGVLRLNMGLSPLAGLEDAPDTLINRTLRFVYSNGDRFYSFQGLYKFKAKYEPKWSDRYIAYKGNPTDVLRVMRALMRAMKV